MSRRNNFKCSLCEHAFTRTEQRIAHAAFRHPNGAVWHNESCTTTLRSVDDVMSDPSRYPEKPLFYVVTCDAHGTSFFASNKVEVRKYRAVDFCHECCP